MCVDKIGLFAQPFFWHQTIFETPSSLPALPYNPGLSQSFISMPSNVQVTTGVLVAKTVCGVRAAHPRTCPCLARWPCANKQHFWSKSTDWLNGDLETGRKPRQRGDKAEILKNLPQRYRRLIPLQDYLQYTYHWVLQLCSEKTKLAPLNEFISRPLLWGAFILIPEIPWHCLQNSWQILYLTILNGGKYSFFETACYFQK